MWVKNKVLVNLLNILTGIINFLGFGLGIFEYINVGFLKKYRKLSFWQC
jgi:hypothetical protein